MVVATPTSIHYTSIVPGDVFSVGPNWGEKSVRANNAQAWTKGQLLQVDQATGIVHICPAGTTLLGKFCVAARDKTSTSAEGIVFGKDAIDKIALKADGVIIPNNKVKPATTTLGEVDDFVEGTTSEILHVGNYVGHGDEVGSGDKLNYTNAADGDTIVVEINPANWL